MSQPERDRSDTKSITQVVDEVLEKADNESEVAVQDLLEAFAGRSYGPLLLAPGIAMVSPLGWIPTVPSFLAVFLFLVSIQLAFGRKYPWIPKWLREKGVEHDKAEKKLDEFRPAMEKMENYIRPRMTVLADQPMPQIIGVLVSILALCTPPLELLPLAAVLPGFAVCILGVGLTSKDGAFVLVGLVVSSVALYLAGTALLG